MVVLESTINLKNVSSFKKHNTICHILCCILEETYDNVLSLLDLFASVLMYFHRYMFITFS